MKEIQFVQPSVLDLWKAPIGPLPIIEAAFRSKGLRSRTESTDMVY